MSTSRLTEFASKAELEQYLRAIGATALIGRGAESPKKFYVFLTGEEKVKAVGIICSFHGVKPAVIRLSSADVFVVGHDCTVTALDSSSAREKFSFRLNGVFFEFVFCASDGVVIVHELGAIKISSHGKPIWNVDTDVIENFHLTGDGSLVLKPMGSNSKVIDVASGKVINESNK